MTEAAEVPMESSHSNHTTAEDKDLSKLASSQLSLKPRGVPGFPDFPDCWNGSEGSSAENPIDAERAMILLEAKALKKAAQQVRHRRTAVNKAGLRKTGSINNTSSTKKAHKKTRPRFRERLELSQLRRSLRSLRLNGDCKLD